MNRSLVYFAGLSLLVGSSGFKTAQLIAGEPYTFEDLSPAPDEKTEATDTELKEAKEAMEAPKAEKPSKKRSHRAEAFVVGPDWEFDGFVAGGQDQNIKSMFAVNDLVYLNIGTSHGFSSGDRVGIYRRGERIRDPQNNRVMGFEVRKIAVSEVSDRIESSNCSARILKSFEDVQIGDLVRRED